MERKLATIERILEVSPIEGADAIEKVRVRGWDVVTKKGEYRMNELCVYCEIDSVLPVKEEFAFLKKNNYRVRTIKLRGQISQGIVFPISILPAGFSKTISEGVDVTDDLGIIKYEPPIPASLGGQAKGNFPSFIPKTHEERIQNMWPLAADYKNTAFYVTEKLDGTSFTAYQNKGEFGVCSRNIEYKDTPNNIYWQAAKMYDIEAKLREYGKDIAIQGELIGPGIQKNRYKLDNLEIAFFNVYDIEKRSYMDYWIFLTIVLNNLKLKTVPIISGYYVLPETLEDILLYSEGYSCINKNCLREGIVIRPQKESQTQDGRLSFKAVSNKYLLQND